jgi:hypothetical protein
MKATLDRWQRAGDERMWKLIISPEFGERVDLQKLTRELMTQMGCQLRSPLEWAAVNHHNTEHPHVHVALRGVDGTGKALRLERDFIKNGIRTVAEDLCTRQLGHRTDRDTAEAAAREVREQRYTSLDRDISRKKNETDYGGERFQIVVPTGSSGSAGLRDRYLAERLAFIEKMGLAEHAGPNTWQVRSDFETVLRAMQRVNDRQRTIAAYGVPVSDPRLPFVMLDLKTLKSVEGRVLVHGEEEDGRDAGRGYFLLEGTDARVYYVPYRPEIEDARNQGALRTNSFVRLRKLFVDGKPLLETDDFGSAEAILTNKRHLNEAALGFVSRGVPVPENGWGGWLGRYQTALKAASIELGQGEARARKTNPRRSGVER